MRTPDDLIKIKVTMNSVLSLDRERIIQDPVWAGIADNYNLEDPEQAEQALFLYLVSYIQRQQLFGECIFMPATNGPSDLLVDNMEDITNGDGNS
jgi:hypothetical protein